MGKRILSPLRCLSSSLFLLKPSLPPSLLFPSSFLLPVFFSHTFTPDPKLFFVFLACFHPSIPHLAHYVLIATIGPELIIHPHAFDSSPTFPTAALKFLVYSALHTNYIITSLANLSLSPSLQIQTYIPPQSSILRTCTF